MKFKYFRSTEKRHGLIYLEKTYESDKFYNLKTNLCGEETQYSVNKDSWVTIKKFEVAIKNGSESKALQLERELIYNILPTIFTDEFKVYEDVNQEIASRQSTDNSGNNQKNLKIRISQNLIDFFKDFEFLPAVRFVNTLKQNCSTKTQAQEYITNYFDLIDHPQKYDVREKLKSPEFSEMYAGLKEIESSKVINERLILYYGPQGTFKTTEAIKNYPQAKVIVCNNSMMPSDLLENFDFNDVNGNPVFKKSELRIAMETGQPIILDEINLLTLDCLRMLQGYLDSKTEVIYKDSVINIAPGFKIIGTMNLSVNGQIFSLPEPLVDRAKEIRQFNMTPQQLAVASF